MIIKFCNRLFYYLTWFLIWPFFKFFNRFKIKRPRKLKAPSPVIIVSNHPSYLDSFLIGVSFIPWSNIHPIRFMTADKWMNGLTGFFIRALGGFPAYLGQGLEKSLKQPKEILKQNGTLLMFPRGRCIKRFHPSKAKIGAAILSLETNTPILPIKISDPHPKNLIKFFLRKRKIKIIIGKPFYLSDKLKKKKNYTRQDFDKARLLIAKEIGKLVYRK